MVAYLPRANRYGHRDTTIVLVAYRHGLRASELVATLPSAGPRKAHRLRSAIFWCSSRLSIRLRNLRRALPAQIDPDYRPAARCPMARHDRRTYHRRRHPRPDNPQCPSYRPRRRQHAKEKSRAPLDRRRKQRNEYQLTSTTRQPKASAATLSAI